MVLLKKKQIQKKKKKKKNQMIQNIKVLDISLIIIKRIIFI